MFVVGMVGGMDEDEWWRGWGHRGLRGGYPLWLIWRGWLGCDFGMWSYMVTGDLVVGLWVVETLGSLLGDWICLLVFYMWLV